MLQKTKIKIMGVAVLVLAAIGFAPEAKAYDQSYCREYNRTVQIGGQIQNAYGTACMQPDGDWVIVGEGLGADIPSNVTNVNYVVYDNNRRIVPNRVVYYDRSYYRSPRVQPSFIWNHNGHYKDRHFVKYDRKPNFARHNPPHKHPPHKHGHRGDRYDNHGKGRGHDRH